MNHFDGDVRVIYWENWKVLLGPLAYVDDDPQYCITVPARFVTDFASIPRLFWAILPPDDMEYRAAAICHDRAYETHELTKTQADEMLLRAMAVYGTPLVKRRAIYLAVRTFGHAAYDSGPKRQVERLAEYQRYLDHLKG